VCVTDKDPVAAWCSYNSSTQEASQEDDEFEASLATQRELV
jgi:hypothetical protein